MERRRRRAARLLRSGRRVCDVARVVGADDSSVSRWKRALGWHGLRGLAARPAPGRPAGLDGPRRRRLARLLGRGPEAHGFPTGLWTLRRVAEVIERHFGRRYHPSSVWHILRAIPWTPQVPARRAGERDERAIRGWGRRDRPRILKKPRRAGRHVVVLDESGFMLQPTRRRTWAPRGRTPVLRCWDRRDRLSFIAALTVSPGRRHLGLYFDAYGPGHNAATGEVCVMVLGMLRRFPRGIVLVLDRLPAHRSAAARLLRAHGDRIGVEWLPAYAPDLNPVEGVWKHAKYDDLANFCPGHAEDLRLAVEDSICRAARRPPLLRSFFEHAGLRLWWAGPLHYFFKG